MAEGIAPDVPTYGNDFPENAIAVLAGRVDVARAGGHNREPESSRCCRTNAEIACSLLITMAGLDLAKDVAPYIGPDWGMCRTARGRSAENADGPGRPRRAAGQKTLAWISRFTREPNSSPASRA